MKTMIRDLRNRAGMTQAELAALVEITRPYLSQLENGERNLSLSLQKRLADALGCDPRDLVDFEADAESDEDVILRAYRSMPADWRRIVLEMARKLTF